MADYRGLSFINCDAKLYSALLLGRLEEHIQSERILDENQCGFRKGYSTVDAIFTLTNLVQLKISSGPRQKLYAFFVDFKAAFDGIQHNLLFQKLNAMGMGQRFIASLEALYRNGTGSVWAKNGISPSFPIECGVRQGCLLSPQLFALYINDLAVGLPHGMKVGGIVISALMYADDIVILAESAVDLRRNILHLESYCVEWGLTVNLNKSKIMVFRRGGRLGTYDSFLFNGRPVEVVPSYKYLGVLLTSKLSFGQHFTERASAAKLGINNIYRSMFCQPTVPIHAKFEVFNGVARAVMCYAAQVTGFMQSNALEQVLRYFVKMIFWLPGNTPNYFVYLESGAEPMFVYTLSLACNYVVKALRMPEHRFPRIVAREVASRKIYWYAALADLAQRHGCQFDGDVEDLDAWGDQLALVLDAIRQSWVEDMKVGAMESRNPLYRHLDHDVRPADLRSKNAGLPLWVIRWVLKFRGSLLALNDGTYRRSDSPRRICSMCNLEAEEDIIHFFGVCPVLGEFRSRFFGLGQLQLPDMARILNSREDWLRVGSFGYHAWKYRAMMVNEFNWEGFDCDID